MRFLKMTMIAGLALLAAGKAPAQFLDFSRPARATALGGNLVALPEASSALSFNPAGLFLQRRFAVYARYESLFSGIGGNDLSNGNLTAVSGQMGFGAMGLSWDHLGSNYLQQDRVRAAWGNGLRVGGFLGDIAAGFSLSYLNQRYTLSNPLAGVSLAGLSPSAFSFGGGLLLTLPLNSTVGFSAEDINQPNMGVVGIDRQPVLMRWGLATEIVNRGPVRLTLTGAQSFNNSRLETQGGAEVFFPHQGIRVRGGMDQYQGAAGFGYVLEDLYLDYAYSFSISPGAQISGTGLPGSHLVELGFQWGALPSSAAYTEFMKKAGEAEADGQWERAHWYYKECHAIRPDKAALDGQNRVLANFNRARAAKRYKDAQEARGKGLFLEARADLELATQLDPGQSEYRRALSQVTLEAAKLLSKQEVAATVQEASDLLDKKNPRGALNKVNQALRKHPNHPVLELVKKMIEDEMGVEAPVPKAAQEAKTTAKLATAEADLYLSRGRADLAKENLMEALKAQPQNLELKKKLRRLEAPTPVVSPENQKLSRELYEKGLQKYLEGDLRGAIADWEKAAKADPTHTRVQNNLIRAKIEEKLEHP